MNTTEFENRSNAAYSANDNRELQICDMFAKDVLQEYIDGPKAI